MFTNQLIWIVVLSLGVLFVRIIYVCKVLCDTEQTPTALLYRKKNYTWSLFVFKSVLNGLLRTVNTEVKEYKPMLMNFKT